MCRSSSSSSKYCSIVVPRHFGCTLFAHGAFLLLLLIVVNVNCNDSNNNNASDDNSINIDRENVFFKENDDDDSLTIDRLYHLWDAQSIQERLLEWNTTYTELVRVETSQQAFGLPASGVGSNRNDCPFDDDIDGCYNYFVTIQDFVAHPVNSPSSNRLPEVLWSGALHGNERVGPTAVMEAAELLLLAASCEALKRSKEANDEHFDCEKVDDNDTFDQNDELHNATTDTTASTTATTATSTAARKRTYSVEEEKKVQNIKRKKDYCQCRQELQRSGIDDLHRTWLAKLVSTRRLIVVPTANALGYYRQTRNEGSGMDPNRDFPYDLQDPTLCMQTIAARTMNEIFRQHLIQLSLTFHAGMEVIGYEWGAPSHLGYLSPDDVAQDELARAYSKWGGSFPSSRRYRTGTMNELVYYVRGGFEDWAYAGSWDTDRVIPCNPNTYGGYESSKTIYNNGTLRVFNMLVETSNRREPTRDTLGSSYHVMSINNSASNGHVSRNIRLALGALDLVQPYVDIVGIDHGGNANSMVPVPEEYDVEKPEEDVYIMSTMSRTSKANVKPKTFNNNPQKRKELSIQWTVGGCLTIQETYLWYAKWEDVFHKDSGIQNLTLEAIQEYFERINHTATTFAARNVFQKAKMVGPNHGTGFLNPEFGPRPLSSSIQENVTTSTLGPLFEAAIPLVDYSSTSAQQQQQESSKDESMIALLKNSNNKINSKKKKSNNNNNKNPGPEKIVVVASAIVDQNWKDLPTQSYQPRLVSPQSHIVNARTRKDWYYQSNYNDNGNDDKTTNNAQSIIQGHTQWFSTPITIELSPKFTIQLQQPTDETSSSSSAAASTATEVATSAPTTRTNFSNNDNSNSTIYDTTINGPTDSAMNNYTDGGTASTEIAVVTIRHLFFLATNVDNNMTNNHVLEELIGPYREYIRMIVMGAATATQRQQRKPQRERTLLRTYQTSHFVAQEERRLDYVALLQEESIELKYTSNMNENNCRSNNGTLFGFCREVQGQYDILLAYNVDDPENDNDHLNQVKMKYFNSTESGIMDGSFEALVPNSVQVAILTTILASPAEPFSSLAEDGDPATSFSTWPPATQGSSPLSSEEMTTEMGISWGAIVGVILGGFTVGILCGIFIVHFHSKGRRKNSSHDPDVKDNTKNGGGMPDDVGNDVPQQKKIFGDSNNDKMSCSNKK